MPPALKVPSLQKPESVQLWLVIAFGESLWVLQAKDDWVLLLD